MIVLIQADNMELRGTPDENGVEITVRDLVTNEQQSILLEGKDLEDYKRFIELL